MSDEKTGKVDGKGKLAVVAKLEFKVDKNVKVPARAGRSSKYPFATMAIGESFLVENGSPKSLAGVAYQSGKKLNMKFTYRNVDGGVRIWRTK